MKLSCKHLFLFLCCSSGVICDIELDKEKFKKDLESYIEHGNRTEYLQQIFTIVQDDKDERFLFSEETVNRAKCIACEGTFLFFIFKRRRFGLSREQLKPMLLILCYALQERKVCDGLIESNLDIFLYIIDNRPNLDGDYICSVIFQDKGCVSEEMSDWSVNVPDFPENNQNLIRANYDESQSKSLNVLHITDIHYDPRYKPGGLANCNAPLCCQDDDKDPVVEADKAGYWSDYRYCDAPKHLILNAFDHIRRQHKNIDLIYFTGDIISHRVWDTSVENNVRDIKEIMEIFRQYFDGIPIYPIFGNHEPHPLNVFAPERVQDKFSTRWLYNLAADEWSTWLPDESKSTILKGGYYSTLVYPGFRVVGMNSNICYSYNWWVLYDQKNLMEHLQWLSDTLAQAERNQEAVHILSHIPPGDPTCLKTWSREFRRIIERFHDTVKGIFYGHTHFDEFVVVYNKSNLSQALNVAHNGGSLTPFNDLNPNYKMFEITEINHEIENYHQWIFNLTLANLTPNKPPNWFKLYSFKEEYKVNDMRPTTVAKIVDNIALMSALSKKYQRFKVKEADSALTSGCDEDCMQRNLCDIVRNEYGDDRKCNIVRQLYAQRKNSVE